MMQDGQFKQAPARPPAPPAPPQQDAAAPAGVKTIADQFNLPPKLLETKPMAALFGAVLFLGLIVGYVMFGGQPPAQCPPALTGIVANEEISGPLNRCGTVDRNYDCVYYFVNPGRRELEAREFFGQIADLTGVQKFMIETSNLRYANKLIRPGYIGQFKVPAYR